MTTTSSAGEPGRRTVDREIMISRVYRRPRELVFEAFTEVQHLSPLGAVERHHLPEGCAC